MNHVQAQRSFSSVRDAAARHFRLYRMSLGGVLALCFLSYYAIGIWQEQLSHFESHSFPYPVFSLEVCNYFSSDSDFFSRVSGDILRFPLGWLPRVWNAWRFVNLTGHPEREAIINVLLLVANAFWLGHTFAPLALCFAGRDRKQHLRVFVSRFWLMLVLGYAILSHDRYSIAIVAMIFGLVAWLTRSWPLFWGAVIGGIAGAEWRKRLGTIDAGFNPGLLWHSRWEFECSLVPALVGGMLGGGLVVITTFLFRRFHGRFKTERPEDIPVS